MQNGKNRVILLVIAVIAPGRRAILRWIRLFTACEKPLLPLDAGRTFEIDKDDVHPDLADVFEVDIDVALAPTESPSARRDDA